MEINKIIGYVLLAVGILLIIVPLWQTYGIFTGKSMPSQVFKRPEVLKANDKASAFDMQAQMQNALIKIIPIEFIDNTLNLSAWLILMWILIYGGGKLADIGIKLLKS